MSGLDCEICGCKLHLMHGDKFMILESGEKIAFANVPLLVCGGCQKKYIPYQTKELLDAFQRMLEDNKYENQTQNIDIVEKEEDIFVFLEEETETRYDFGYIKNKFLFYWLLIKTTIKIFSFYNINYQIRIHIFH